MKEYLCPKCGMEYDSPGKCKMCNVTLVKKNSKIKHEGMDHGMHKEKIGKKMQKMDHKNMNHEMKGMNHHEMMVKDYRLRFFVSLIFAIPIIILSPLIQEVFNYNLTFDGYVYVLFALSSIVYFYGGWPFLKGIVNEIKEKKPGMMMLVAVAITVSYFYSSAIVFGLSGKFFFWELATLIAIMLLGHWIEMRSMLGASKALESLAKLMPKEAHLIKDGETVDVLISELKKGYIVLVKPGEKLPADGIIVKGSSSVNESMLTGESKPVNKNKGDIVIGGSINGSGAMEIRVTNAGEDSYISQVIKLVKEAQESKSKTQDLANTAAMWLTIIAITLGIMTFVAWMLMLNDLAFSLERMVTVIVIACPHALGLAVPLVVAVSTSISAKNGLLIRNRVAFENARNINTIVFDKTGTLTNGEFGITDIIAFNGFKEKEVLTITASLEFNSTHPIALGIISESKKYKIKLINVEKFNNIPGKGVKGIINKKEYFAVGKNYLIENKIGINEKSANDLATQGKTIVYLILENKIIGVLALGDSIRPESRQAIKELKQIGIKCMMLTGDNRQVADWVSKELNLDDYFAEILPHEKSKTIKEIQSKGLKVAMVGDGVNDAPALTQADVGIAIGAGTDVAVEAADIVLVSNNPKDVVAIIGLAKATYEKMKQNLIWATGYNIIALPLAAGALYNYGMLLNPAIGAALMSLSTVIVAINAGFLKVKK